MKKTLIIISLTVLVVLAAEYLVYTLSLQKKENHTVKEFRKSGYKMINPVLDFYELEPVLVREVKDLQADITGYIAQVKEEKKVDMVSVYFRDLNNGPWVGIGEDEVYSPASLLKVPFLIAVLKEAEDDPAFLSKKIFYSAQQDNEKRNIVDGYGLVPGKEYTINELLKYMIVHSDNDAQNLLVTNLKTQALQDIFYDMGLPVEKYYKADNFLTVKEYAAYFRILYNATYLNRKMSEKALTLLSQTTFNRGIVAGVPGGVTVAHKFGERFYPEKKIRQLHDCGIVYKNKNPYLVCVMTKGADFETLAKVIADISAIIYNSDATAVTKLH